MNNWSRIILLYLCLNAAYPKTKDIPVRFNTDSDHRRYGTNLILFLIKFKYKFFVLGFKIHRIQRMKKFSLRYSYTAKIPFLSLSFSIFANDISEYFSFDVLVQWANVTRTSCLWLSKLYNLHTIQLNACTTYFPLHP